MPSDTTQHRVAEESLARRHEVSEKRLRNVLLVGAAAWFLLIASLVTSGLIFHNFAQQRSTQDMRPLGLITAPNLKPLQRFPKPNLQIDDDHAEMSALVATQNDQLNSYGWVNHSNGIVRVPISRAMDLLLQRGLPTQTNSKAQTDGSALELIQQIPKE